MNKSIKRISSIVLAAAVAACTPLLSIYAKAESVEESAAIIGVDTEPISSVLSEKDIPECLALEVSENDKFAARLYEKETELDTVLFANKDGSETIYIFNEDVKYIDVSGKVADKSNKLYSDIGNVVFSSDYSYVNKENDINTYFPKTLKTDVGVSVEAQGQVIEMYPVSDVVSKVTADNDMYGVYYDDVFGEFTGIRYEPSFSGYKEDIVLEKNVGNKFGFILETGDLVPVLENGVIYIRDESGADFGLISPIYVYDSFVGDASVEEERHFTYNNKFELTPISKGKYELVVIVDEDFLNNPATVYPVIVDPSVTIDATGSGSSKSILDTPIYNGDGVSGTAGVNQLAVVGYVDSTYGSGRLLMRFPGLMNKAFMNGNYTIDSAKLTINECSGGSASSIICAYNYTGPDWNESTSYSSSVYNGIGSLLDSQVFSYPNHTKKTYDITLAARNWKANPSQGAKGIIFKNFTSETDYSNSKTFYTTEGTTKPCLSVTYSPFYGCRGVFYTSSKNINCQGFAFGTNDKPEFLLDGDFDTFRRTNDEYALSETKKRLKSWLDKEFLGRWKEVDSYDAYLDKEEWIVAMRVGVNIYPGDDESSLKYYGYHFWYRASDGKWYNKHEDNQSKEVSGNVVNPSTANTSDGWKHEGKYFYTSKTAYYVIRRG